MSQLDTSPAAPPTSSDTCQFGSRERDGADVADDTNSANPVCTLAADVADDTTDRCASGGCLQCHIIFLATACRRH